MNEFLKQKKNILNKKDKSAKGEIDLKIRSLCETINKREDMFSLSSCSGRGCLLALAEKNIKKETIWLFNSHSLDNPNNFLKEFDDYEGKNILYFKEESAIIHIQTKTLDLAQKLISLGKQSSFNRCSIIAVKRKIVVEIASSIPISVPIYDKKKLVNNEYLEYLINISKKKLEKSWLALKKLENNIMKLNEN